MSGLKWSSLTPSCTRCLIVLLILQSSQVLGESVDNLSASDEWDRSDPRVRIHPAAFPAGPEDNNAIVYVGRAKHNGDLLPAKVIPAYRKAYVSYNGKEYIKYDIEILLRFSNNYKWTRDSNGHVPSNAVPGGHTAAGETLYIGRIVYKGSTVVGKIQPSQKCMYFPYGGGEYYTNAYDVLVRG